MAVCCAEEEMSSLIRRAYSGFIAEPNSGNEFLRAAINIEGRLPSYMVTNIDVDKTPAEVCRDGERIHFRSDWFHGLIDLISGCSYLWCPIAAHPFDTLIRLIYVNTGSVLGSLILHGTGIKFGQRAVIALGPSGSGKSTLAAAASGEALSDELVTLRQCNAKYLVGGTPFWNGRNEEYGAAAVLYLKQSDRNKLLPISKDEAFRLFIREVQTPGLDPTGLSHIWEVAANFIEEVPVFWLEFTLRDDMWNEISANLKSSLGST